MRTAWDVREKQHVTLCLVRPTRQGLGHGLGFHDRADVVPDRFTPPAPQPITGMLPRHPPARTFMPDSSPTNSKIVAAYREKTPRSEAMAQQARDMFPSGITHDSRRITPYAIYVDRAQGSRKWDVDGNEYVDYYGGHGALILGHNHPKMPDRKSTPLNSSHQRAARIPSSPLQ